MQYNKNIFMIEVEHNVKVDGVCSMTGRKVKIYVENIRRYVVIKKFIKLIKKSRPYFPNTLTFHQYYYNFNDSERYEKGAYFYLKNGEVTAKYKLVGCDDGFGQGSAGKNYLKKVDS